MLSTVRQGARLTPRLVTVASAFCQALPAESSRQAQVRSISAEASSPTPTLSRGYAAAASLASAASGELHCSSTSSSGGPASAGRAGRLPSLSFHESRDSPRAGPASDGLDAPLTAGERFRRHWKRDPVRALLSLRSMPEEDLETIEYRDLNSLLFHLTAQLKSDPSARTRVSAEDATQSLKVVRALLHRRPTLGNSNRDAFLGKALHGELLRALLRAGILLGASPLVLEVFAERMDQQLRTGQKIVDMNGLALDLVNAREWSLAATLFRGPSAEFPRALFTPEVVSAAMTANLHLSRPQAALKLFDLLEPGKATADIYGALIQAQLQLGDMDAARETVLSAKAAGVDLSLLQLAILRGYKALGFDVGVEERAKQDLEQLGIAPQAPFVNQLMRSRIDAGDLDAAEALLAEFRDGKVEPNDDTMLIAMSIASRRSDVRMLHQLWESIVASPRFVSDNAVAHLFRALGRLGREDEVFKVFYAAVHKTRSPWPLPATFAPGIKTGNVVLEMVASVESFSKVAEMMRTACIEPDAHTITIVLEFARRHLVSSPASLSKLLRDMLDRAANSEPSVHQLDVVIAEAVRTATQERRQQRPLTNVRPPPSALSSDDPTGGVETSGSLRSLLEHIVRSLRDRNHKGTARSLANRILYDSLAIEATHGVPPARQVWHALALRGYRPDHRHFLALVKGYTIGGAMNEAEDAVLLAQEHGIAPSSRLLTQLVVGWAMAGNLPQARATYERIRRTPGLLDAVALNAMVRAYVERGQPDKGVHLAREDLPVVRPDDVLVVTVSHAIRKANDVAGAVFFIARNTQLDHGDPAAVAAALRVGDLTGLPQAAASSWALTSPLRRSVRKCLNYLSKQDPATLNPRAKEAVDLGYRMLAYDDHVRARPSQTPALDRATRHFLASLFGPPAPAPAPAPAPSRTPKDAPRTASGKRRRRRHSAGNNSPAASALEPGVKSHSGNQ